MRYGRRISSICIIVVLAMAAVAQPSLAAAQDRETVSRLIVMIRGTLGDGDTTGAGIIVGRTADRIYIATANHLVRRRMHEAEALEVLFRWRPGEWAEARLLSNADSDLDLAVLSVADPDMLGDVQLPWEALADPGELAAGMEARPIGNPSGQHWFAPVGPHLVHSTTSDTILTEGQYVPGHSGGALVTGDWRIVGLVRDGSALLGQAIRMDRVTERLAVWGYPIALSIGPGGGTAPDLPSLRLSATPLGQWGSEGEGPGRFVEPWGIAASFSLGRVYVADRNGVQVFSMTGAYHGELVTDQGAIVGNFVTENSNGAPYALNFNSWNGQDQRVEFFEYGGQRSVGSFPIADASPRSIDTDIYGEDIFVTDIRHNRVLRYSGTGQLVGTWGQSGTALGQFRDPWGIAVDRYQNRRVYVADTGNNRIQVFTRDGVFVTSWGSPGSGVGQFDQPIDVAVDPEGRIYVLDKDNARVQVFSSDGEILGVFGSLGSGPGEFLDPYGISVDGRGVVYVTDTGNSRVQYFGISAAP